jgi:hypothetical protein
MQRSLFATLKSPMFTLSEIVGGGIIGGGDMGTEVNILQLDVQVRHSYRYTIFCNVRFLRDLGHLFSKSRVATRA